MVIQEGERERERVECLRRGEEFAGGKRSFRSNFNLFQFQFMMITQFFKCWIWSI